MTIEQKHNISKEALAAKTTLKEFISEFTPVIEAFFNSYEPRVKKTFRAEGHNSFLNYKEITMRDAKRFRASFVYYLYKLYGGKDFNLALQVGVVIELIHSYLLVVDDFMDKSDTRRSGPSSHKIVEKKLLEGNYYNRDIVHAANAIAVNIGLIGNHMAHHYLADLQIDPKIKEKLFSNLSKELVVTGLGQLTDVYNELKKQITEQEVIDVLSWKTGAYTYENPIHMGMLLAGVTDSVELDKMSAFAIPAGIAFQIQDDILGVFGEISETGKSNVSDLEEGKLTLLTFKALESGSQAQVKRLREILGSNNITVQDYQDAKQIIIESRALEYSQKKALEYAEKALEALERAKKPNWDELSYDYLVGITKYTVERTK